MSDIAYDIYRSVHDTALRLILPQGAPLPPTFGRPWIKSETRAASEVAPADREAVRGTGYKVYRVVWESTAA